MPSLGTGHGGAWSNPSGCPGTARLPGHGSTRAGAQALGAGRGLPRPAERLQQRASVPRTRSPAPAQPPQPRCSAPVPLCPGALWLEAGGSPPGGQRQNAASTVPVSSSVSEGGSCSSPLGSWLLGKLKPPGSAPGHCLPLSGSQKAAIGNTWASEGARRGGGGCMVFPPGFSCAAGKAELHTAMQHLAEPVPCTLCHALCAMRSVPAAAVPFFFPWPQLASLCPAHMLPELSCCACGAGPSSVSQEQWGGRMQIPRPEWVPPCAERSLGKETLGSTQAGQRVMVLS